jgi:hypothetical protein
MKKWYQSKTIGGILIAAIGALFLYFGLDPDTASLPANADVETVKTYVETIKNAQGNVGTIIGVVLNAVGTVLALIGRIKAETVIATPTNNK